MKAIRILALVLALSLLLVGLAGSAVPDAIDRWVIAGGGGQLTDGGHVRLNATVGQPITGPSAGDRLQLNAGYWQQVPEPPIPAYFIYLPVVLRDAP